MVARCSHSPAAIFLISLTGILSEYLLHWKSRQWLSYHRPNLGRNVQRIIQGVEDAEGPLGWDTLGSREREVHGPKGLILFEVAIARVVVCPHMQAIIPQSARDCAPAEVHLPKYLNKVCLYLGICCLTQRDRERLWSRNCKQ